jgi:hypothetical protein
LTTVSLDYDPPSHPSWVARITDVSLHAWLNYISLILVRLSNYTCLLTFMSLLLITNKYRTTRLIWLLLLLFGSENRWLKPLKNMHMEHLMSALWRMHGSDGLNPSLLASVSCIAHWTLKKGRDGMVVRKTGGSMETSVKRPIFHQTVCKSQKDHGRVYENVQIIRNEK